ncbi:hypothetical protein OCAR_6060 [Afipia carboxidovorans OM5]|nr:hypothetical protein OCAR_6060 [Afipia carboxidovorans OM5]
MSIRDTVIPDRSRSGLIRNLEGFVRSHSEIPGSRANARVPE